MLFDLRGAGRRRTVKFVYVGLALIMFVGFVGFSIGSSGLSGGIVDAITSNNGGGGDGSDRFTQRAQAAERSARANPTDAAAWAAAARARFQLAGTGKNYDTNQNDYTASGKAQLAAAGRDWERYIALNPRTPDDRLASVMVQAYTSLGQPAKAVAAQEIITEARPSAATFAQLAVYAYQAGQTRTGDLARRKALDLAPKDQRQALKSQLDQAKQSASTQGIQSPTPSGG